MPGRERFAEYDIVSVAHKLPRDITPIIVHPPRFGSIGEARRSFARRQQLVLVER